MFFPDFAFEVGFLCPFVSGFDGVILHQIKVIGVRH